MDVEGIDWRQPHFPSFRLEPALYLFGRRLLRALAAVPNQDAAGFDHIEVAALEGRGRDHLVNRDSLGLIELDDRRVFAAPPPLVHLSHHRAERRHGSRPTC